MSRLAISKCRQGLVGRWDQIAGGTFWCQQAGRHCGRCWGCWRDARVKGGGCCCCCRQKTKGTDPTPLAFWSHPFPRGSHYSSSQPTTPPQAFFFCFYYLLLFLIKVKEEPNPARVEMFRMPWRQSGGHYNKILEASLF